MEEEMKKNFIEKMAVWYELKYPDQDVYNLPFCEGEYIPDEYYPDDEYIFEDKTNPYLSSKKVDLNWNEFYSFKNFYNTLSHKEKELIKKPEFNTYGLDGSNFCLCLNKNGYIDDIIMDDPFDDDVFDVSPEDFDSDEDYSDYMDAMFSYYDEENPYENFIGKSVLEFLNYLKHENDEEYLQELIEEEIKRYQDLTHQREEMLNSVTYRIIQRGANRIGARRALLFAKEFNSNIDLPMIYGIDLKDPYLNDFIDDYLSSGGHKDIKCLVDGKYIKLEDILLKNKKVKRLERK